MKRRIGCLVVSILILGSIFLVGCNPKALEDISSEYVDSEKIASITIRKPQRKEALLNENNIEGLLNTLKEEIFTKTSGAKYKNKNGNIAYEILYRFKDGGEATISVAHDAVIIGGKWYKTSTKIKDYISSLTLDWQDF